MTASDFRTWLSVLADAAAVVPASEVLARLPEAEEHETGESRFQSGTLNDIELTWRERLWLVPSETRLGAHEVCEALARSSWWLYRHTGPKAGDPLPHRLLDGQLVFVAGEIRHWIREHEESVFELPMDRERRQLKVMGT